ncbi:MAG TPA: hypothetical protein VH858_09650 [Hyphomicrobiales bacterium]|jgi:hypothetical protein
MEYLNQLGNEYAGLSTILGSIFGIAGFVFGAWRYFREIRALKELQDSQQNLDNALARLQHLEKFASELKQYSAAV